MSFLVTLRARVWWKLKARFLLKFGPASSVLLDLGAPPGRIPVLSSYLRYRMGRPRTCHVFRVRR